MTQVRGDHAFNLAIAAATWVRMQPNPADPTIPVSGHRIRLMNAGAGVVYVIKRQHVAGSPSPALPATTPAAAQADAGLKVLVYSGEIPEYLDPGGWSGSVNMSDYYCLSDDAAGTNLICDPVNL